MPTQGHSLHRNLDCWWYALMCPQGPQVVYASAWKFSFLHMWGSTGRIGWWHCQEHTVWQPETTRTAPQVGKQHPCYVDDSRSNSCPQIRTEESHSKNQLRYSKHDHSSLVFLSTCFNKVTSFNSLDGNPVHFIARPKAAQRTCKGWFA